jgi:hypothetical protein
MNLQQAAAKLVSKDGSRSISQVAGAVAQFVLLHRGKASSV